MNDIDNDNAYSVISIKSVHNLIFPLFLGVDQSPEGEVVVTCNQSMKEEAEAVLFHFGICLGVQFGSLVCEAFTDPYRTSMKAFQNCPLIKCAVERTATTEASMTSSIAIDDSANSFDRGFAKWGLTNNLREVPYEIEFDLTYQVSLHVGSDICDILGDI